MIKNLHVPRSIAFAVALFLILILVNKAEANVTVPATTCRTNISADKALNGSNLYTATGKQPAATSISLPLLTNPTIG